MNTEEKQKKILEKIKNVESQIGILNELKGKLLSELDTTPSDHSLEIGHPPQITPAANSLTKSEKGSDPIRGHSSL